MLNIKWSARFNWSDLRDDTLSHVKQYYFYAASRREAEKLAEKIFRREYPEITSFGCGVVPVSCDFCGYKFVDEP